MTEPPSAGTAPAGWQRDFLQRHRLPASYLEQAARCFDPLADCLHARSMARPGPLLVALNGCQGSGKSTLCDYIASRLGALHGCKAAVLSLDDFYLTRAERARLAARVHPLFTTRGVPGTHDMPLLENILDALQQARSGEHVDIPRFDKGMDERAPRDRWSRTSGPLELILLEGWCLGARPEQSVQPPINALEASEDADGQWRHHVNEALRSQFLPLYRRIDLWIMLRAPDFETVYGWRLEQEHKLAQVAAGNAVMSDAEVARFIQHYERLTRHCLSMLPADVDILYQLDRVRAVSAVRGALRGQRGAWSAQGPAHAAFGSTASIDDTSPPGT